MDKQKQLRRIYDIVAHEGDDYVQNLGAMGTPIYQTSLFVDCGLEHNYGYTRSGNPTFDVGEQKIALMEKAEDAAFTSAGMSAISLAMLSCVKTGEHILTLKNVYGGSKLQLKYFERFGIETSYVPGNSLDDFENAIRPNTRLIYLESPSTFMFEMQDIEEIVKLAKSKGIRTMIDNTWATPVYQNPIKYGVDLVIHSCSKYLGGHSDLVGGVIVGAKELIEEIRKVERLNFGCQMDPHQAWMTIRGIRTLPVRLEQSMQNTTVIANFLEKHPCVQEVKWPGLASYPQKKLADKYLYGCSGLFSIITKGTMEQARNFVGNTAIFNRAPSWGGYDSLITAVGCTQESVEQNSITPGLIRVAIGLESSETLMEALDTSLRKYIKYII